MTAAEDSPTPLTAEIHGSCDDRFAGMRDLLAANLANGNDLGASVAVTLEGELVVDIWGGWADPDRTRPWERDTITNVWSTTKTMTALCALMLVDAGELDLDAPVSTYWPEFAAGGKGGGSCSATSWAIPLGCRAGPSRYGRGPLRLGEGHRLLAAQEPWWEPGTVSGYHAVTQGYLVGEVIRRVTGQSTGVLPGERLRTTRRRLHIGLDPAEFGRVSNVVPPPPIEVYRRHRSHGPAHPGESAPVGRDLLDRPVAPGRDPGRQRSRQRPLRGHHPIRDRQRGRGGGVRLLSEAGCDRILSSSPTARTWCWACPFVSGSVTACPRRRRRS